MSALKGGRWLAGIEDGAETSIRQLEDYLKKNKERPITATRNNTDNTRINRTIITKKTKIGRKAIVCVFQVTKKENLTQEDLDIAKKGKPWETESLLIAAQSNVIRDNKYNKIASGDRDKTFN